MLRCEGVYSGEIEKVCTFNLSIDQNKLRDMCVIVQDSDVYGWIVFVLQRPGKEEASQFVACRVLASSGVVSKTKGWQEFWLANICRLKNEEDR